jgi:hypothetical protein
MITRPKVRRAACRAGVALGAAAALAYIPCLMGGIVAGSPMRSFVLARGAATVYWQPLPAGAWSPGMYMGLDPGAGGPGWWRWLPRWVEPDPVGTSNPTRAMGEFSLPLWMPAALGLLCLYWLLPERGPSHTCECGYDLRAVPRKEGKVTCPECGRTGGAGGSG